METAAPLAVSAASTLTAAACRNCGSAAAARRGRQMAASWLTLLARARWTQLALMLLAMPRTTSSTCDGDAGDAIVPSRQLADQYKNVYGVVGATDLSMFRKVGGGECLAPAARPMRGKSRRDVTHLRCRQLCTDTCLGYTYAPCERVCTLHGNPSTLKNASDAEGWATVNGGGKIDKSSGRCGSSCYQRMAPCDAGSVVSNTHRMAHAALPFAGTTVTTCELPFVGTLRLRCGLFGTYVEAGRCRSPCRPGMMADGNFDVFYPSFLHGTTTSVKCPSGATGEIVMSCTDGTASWTAGRCGYDCVLGTIIVGDAVLSYEAIDHTEVRNLSCPINRSETVQNLSTASTLHPGEEGGNITIECWDSKVSVIAGQCYYNCDEGNVTLNYGDTWGSVAHGAFNNSVDNETACLPEQNFTGMVKLQCFRGIVSISGGYCRQHCQAGTIGPGIKATPYPRFDTDTVIKVPCLPGFEGELVLSCIDGNVTVRDGICMMHCLPGSVTSNSVTIDHSGFNHTTSMNITCPWPSHSGEIKLSCFDGAVTYVSMCGENCQPGHIMSHGATVYYAFFRHAEIRFWNCPAPYVNEPIEGIAIKCWDGTIRYQSGYCGRQCPGGAIQKGGAVAEYPIMNHTQIMNFPCNARFGNTGLTFSGGVKVDCFDGKASAIGGCQADCPDGRTPLDGTKVQYFEMVHNDESWAHCLPGSKENPMFGKAWVKCSRGYTNIVSGSCGAPCLEGEFAGPQTMDSPVIHPDIGHLMSKWVQCPEHLSGRVQLYCFGGTVKVVNGTCGKRCPGKDIEVYGATFRSPLMAHRGRIDWPCDPPFSGVVKLGCDFGFLNITSLCKNHCLKGNTTLKYGAVIDYPQMKHGVLYSTRCPPGFVDVPVTMRCDDGNAVVHGLKGGCFKHCNADWFIDPEQPEGASWTVNHYEILHDSTVLRECPEFFNGFIRLGCWSGKVSLSSGRCSRNCKPGRNVIRPGVIVRNREMISGQMATSVPCPPSFDGQMRLRCDEGLVSLGEGGCNKTCSPNIVRTAPHGELGDNKVAEIACPDTGTITIRCNDGFTTVLDGQCFKGCAAGSQIDANGTRIEHPYIRHNESFAGACSGLAKGAVTVSCQDSVITQTPLPGERCLRFCKSQPVRSADGSAVIAPNTEHGNQATVTCPNDLLGLITLSCFDTDFSIYDGQCGDVNCAAGYAYSNGAALLHGNINNGWTAGPTICPEPYEGVATFACGNGTTLVDEVTIQLPVSPEDFAAVAAGNLSSEDSRFVLCGCCFPRGAPPPPADVEGRDTGIYVWVACLAGGLVIIIAAFSGWYFLPRKKLSKVVPEKPKPVDPRPVHEQDLIAILDEFSNALKNDPDGLSRTMSSSEKFRKLPDKERAKAIADMQENPSEAKKYFSRRSVNYFLAVEDPSSPGRSNSTKSLRDPASPGRSNSMRDPTSPGRSLAGSDPRSPGRRSNSDPRSPGRSVTQPQLGDLQVLSPVSGGSGSLLAIGPGQAAQANAFSNGQPIRHASTFSNGQPSPSASNSDLRQTGNVPTATPSQSNLAGGTSASNVQEVS